MDCRRCYGKGEITPKFGRPGHDRHTPYLGPWCIYPTRPCPVCLGSRWERDKPPPAPYRGPIKIQPKDDDDW